MKLRAKFRTHFPALVTASSPLTLVKTGLTYAFGLDINALGSYFLSTTSTIPASLLPKIASRTITASSDTLVASDYGKTILLNNATSIALAVTAAATLGDGWYCFIQNVNTGVVTIDPNASETIDGASTASIYQGEKMRLVCAGGGFVTDSHAGEWAAYTATVTPSGGGSFTTMSYVARAKKVRTTVFFHFELNVTTVGTATGTTIVSPPPLGTPLRNAFLTGASLNTGKVARGLLSGGNFRCDYYDGTGMLVSGAMVNFDGQYEVAP
ncbi:hypothetical protein QY049_03290 [Bradyrhizobium sp. WYCCWR 13022]|uniref:hypothetical protein n=1 Tax=unclassified Bradyrhizobium TaxID=2631580 RepID=UPI00263B8EEB|nr:hypothetical protein [Bradyrhizobium sp. WYCCWR 13022]MDN4982250.1 hypothetical protein [Bradyrhizobium sp. WYCCWR 13022]